jgi:hypothetical protein
MKIHTRLSRLLRHLPSLALLLTALAAGIAPCAAFADPAARVGRVAYLEGAVDYRFTPDDAWQPAAVNWPLTTGNVFATGPSGRTELRVGSTVIRLAPRSELTIVALDDASMRLYLAHGSATVRIRNAELAREFSLQMPLGQVTLLEPGRMRVDAWQDATGSAAADVHLVDGRARFDPAGASGGGILLAAGSRLDSRNGVVQITDLRAPSAADGFDAWSLARDRSDDNLRSLQYLSPEITGYEELDRNGVWRQTAEYGPVWTPTVVAAGWTPYRTGQWIWVAPWGWTWVDSAPWGYAPSHYGRWVTIGNRWCWSPGAVVARPVWAPALVTWRGGQRWDLADARARPPVGGWVPLAPRAVYVPPYAVSRTYVQQINVTHVTNINQINRFYDNRVAAPQPWRDVRDGHDRREGYDRRDGRDDRHDWKGPEAREGHDRRGGRNDQAARAVPAPTPVAPVMPVHPAERMQIPSAPQVRQPLQQRPGVHPAPPVAPTAGPAALMAIPPAAPHPQPAHGRRERFDETMHDRVFTQPPRVHEAPQPRPPSTPVAAPPVVVPHALPAPVVRGQGAPHAGNPHAAGEARPAHERGDVREMREPRERHHPERQGDAPPR